MVRLPNGAVDALGMTNDKGARMNCGVLARDKLSTFINVASTNPNMCGIVGVNACGECGHCHWNENAAYTSHMPDKAVVSRLLDVLR